MSNDQGINMICFISRGKTTEEQVDLIYLKLSCLVEKLAIISLTEVAVLQPS